MATQPRIDDRPPRRGRSVPLLFGAVSLVLVAVALTFALSSPPPSTPPLAEVAPAPQEQIEVERVEQSSRFGEGAGGEGDCVPGDPGCEGAAPEEPGIDATPPPTADPNASQVDFWPCVSGEGGPRQTHDPQSPPCFGERFAGDNGGATWTGVTRDAIRVAVPHFTGCWGFSNGQVDCDRDIEVLRAFASHVNSHYELYGRRLELVELEEADDDGPAGQRAYAAEIAALEPFAVLGWGGGDLPFHRGLADAELISFAKSAALDEQRGYGRLHPYVWGLFPATEQSGRATGELICRSLAGRTARHGGEGVVERTRRFGVVQGTASGQPIPVATLVSRLEACDAPHTVRRFDRDADDRELLLNALADDGVTTVVCVCGSPLKSWTNKADELGYEPEWLLIGGAAGNTSVSLGAQAEYVFGLTSRLREPAATRPGPNPAMRYEEQFWFRVLKEEMPDWQQRRSDATYASSQYAFYAQLVMLASGVQWAGPELTPENFASALQGLDYPNPGVGREPWFQPAVGFGASDHTFNSDFALAWFDAPDAREEQLNEPGRFCYVGDGLRFTADTMPADADERFFDLEAGCR